MEFTKTDLRRIPQTLMTVTCLHCGKEIPVGSTAFYSEALDSWFDAEHCYEQEKTNPEYQD